MAAGGRKTVVGGLTGPTVMHQRTAERVGWLTGRRRWTVDGRWEMGAQPGLEDGQINRGPMVGGDQKIVARRADRANQDAPVGREGEADRPVVDGGSKVVVAEPNEV